MQGKIFKIESPDRKWRAEISARLGANITKLQFEDEDVFIPLKSEEQLKKDPFVIGSPLLFPANRTYKGEFEFQGIKYNLPINDSLNVSNLHGSLYHSKFEVLRKDDCKIVLSFENKGDIYPFDFKITVEYFLDNNGLKQYFIIKNTGDIQMPYTFALHTTFVEVEKFMVDIDKCLEKDKEHIPTGRYVDLDSQENNYIMGSVSKDTVVSGYYKSRGNTAVVGDYKYTVSDNFDHWVLYNGGGKSRFLCVEPQCGMVNGLNIENGHRILNPNAQEVFHTQITKIQEGVK